MNNLPLDKLNRDELYTFLAGLFVSQIWYLYLVKIKLIPISDTLYIPFILSLWLGSTSIVFILNSLIAVIASEAVKGKEENEKSLLYYATYMDELRMALHLYGIIFVSLILANLPIIDFITTKANIITYYLFTVFIFDLLILLSLVMYRQTFKELITINSHISNGVSYIIDDTLYRNKLTNHFSKKKINEL